MNRQKTHELIFCVYRHVRLDINQPFYIGVGEIKRPYERRKYSRNKHWYNIVKSINYNYRIDILFENISWKEACLKEIEFVTLYGRSDKNKGFLCNWTDGGDGAAGQILTKEHKEKISLSHIGIKKSDETKLAMKIAKNLNDLQNKTECKWCGKLSDRCNSIRNHGNNCKMNPNYIPRITKMINCNSCGKYIDFRNHKRWHGENCKFKK